MKRERELNQDSVSTISSSEAVHRESSTFRSLGLDSRLLQAIEDEAFSSPTLVQTRVIPLALEGKDILGIFIFLST